MTVVLSLHPADSISVLRNLCRYPQGIFIAGDTAQTIAVGSSFRFEDLKSFLYRIEVGSLTDTSDFALNFLQQNDPLVKTQKREAVHPKLWNLHVNYRSHGGIVDCAASVVECITRLFPDSIDSLEREVGIIDDAPKPVFFSGWGHNFGFEQFFEQFMSDGTGQFIPGETYVFLFGFSFL